jgi:hypothetical protein
VRIEDFIKKMTSSNRVERVNNDKMISEWSDLDYKFKPSRSILKHL